MIGLGEVRKKRGNFTTLQSGHLLYHSEANNGQAGVGFLVNKKWKDNITRVSSGNSRLAELVLRITDRYQLKIVRQTNTSERATGCFGLGQRNERGETLVEWATSNNFKIMNIQFQKKAGRRLTWRSPDGHTRNAIDYIMTDKPSMVTDVTVINRVNIGSDHRMGMGYTKHQSRKEEASKQEYTNKSRYSNDWNEEEHVSTRTEKQVHSTRRT